MDLEAVQNYLDKGGKNLATVDRLPSRLFESFVMQGIHIDHIEPGHVLCSMKVSPRLSNTGNFLHGGATAMLVDVVGSAAIYSLGAPISGVSVEINISYLDAAFVDDEIEIEANALHVGKDIAIIGVELRNKRSGKVIAEGRHTKYLTVKSKM